MLGFLHDEVCVKILGFLHDEVCVKILEIMLQATLCDINMLKDAKAYGIINKC